MNTAGILVCPRCGHLTEDHVEDEYPDGEAVQVCLGGGCCPCTESFRYEDDGD